MLHLVVVTDLMGNYFLYGLLYILVYSFNFTYIIREKEGDLAESYEKNPDTNRKFVNQKTTQKRHQNLRLHNDCGPT